MKTQLAVRIVKSWHKLNLCWENTPATVAPKSQVLSCQNSIKKTVEWFTSCCGLKTCSLGYHPGSVWGAAAWQEVPVKALLMCVLLLGWGLGLSSGVPTLHKHERKSEASQWVSGGKDTCLESAAVLRAWGSAGGPWWSWRTRPGVLCCEPFAAIWWFCKTKCITELRAISFEYWPEYILVK